MAENYESVFLTGVRPTPGLGPFVVWLWINFSKFWPGKTSNLYANGPESFPPGFFTCFGRPTGKNYESVFLTVVRPSGAFDQCATKTRVRSFWPSCDYFPLSVLLTNGATNVGLRNRLGKKLWSKKKPSPFRKTSGNPNSNLHFHYFYQIRYR